MFSLIYNSPLSDVLAPRLSPLEEFICQWESFAGFFSQEQNKDADLCKCRIETTNLSSRLSQMLNILLEEQAVLAAASPKDETEICPTLEYVLQNKIFDTLSVIAQADAPLGISPRLLLFFHRLVIDSKTAGLIPLISTSLNKLIYICGKMPAGPYEANEMTFLSGLTDKIYRNPQYLNSFLHDSFPLINSLLSLLCSPDSSIAKQAGDCIIKLICLGNETADQIICEKTAFCGKIIHQIISAYNEIPRSLNPQEVEVAIYTFFRADAADTACHSTAFTNSMRKFLCFLKWYIFFDMLIYHSAETSMLVKTLLSQFRHEFLESFILPDLTGEGFKDEFDAIDNVFLTTVLLSNCLRNTSSYVFFNCISEFLILPHPVDPIIIDKPKNNLFPALLKRSNLANELKEHFCDDKVYQSKRTKLASATLQLFEDILLRPSFNVIDFLVLNHLRRKQYLDSSKTDDSVDSYEPILDKILRPDTLDSMSAVAKETAQLATVSAAPTVGLAKQNAMLHYFSSLIPPELKFNIESESGDYATYLKEAIKAVHIFLTSCYAHWPERILLDSELACEVEENGPLQVDQPENEQSACCSEGPFLQMIFDNLNSMLSLPYEVNLQVFSLIAKLSLIPDEGINEYLLDPTTPLNASSRNLFAVLYRLVEDLQISVKGIAELSNSLCATKKALLGEELSHEEQLLCDGNEGNGTILQSLIVLDEFCKEVVCIIYAKNRIIELVKGQVQS